MALAAYRHLLRSARLAFQGDAHTLTAFTREARQQFDQSRSLSLDQEQIQEGITKAKDVASILRHNLVQGKQEGTEPVYKLRIHDETERGDNESRKQGGGMKSNLVTGQCCQA